LTTVKSGAYDLVWLFKCRIFTASYQGEGEEGNKLPISLHYLAQGKGQGGELRSLPLRIAGIFLRSGFAMQMWNRRDHVSKQDSFLFTLKFFKLTMYGTFRAAKYDTLLVRIVESRIMDPQSA
jgi:hypothetical protein